MRLMKRSQLGFAMLEVMLAVIVIVVASIGVFAMYRSSSNQTADTQIANQLMQIASTYSNLISASLTNSVTSQSSLISLLQNSGQLSSNYFSTGSGSSSSTVINSVYGALSFDNVSEVSYKVTVPYPGRNLQQAVAIFNQVSNSYTCVTNCSIGDDSSNSTNEGAEAVTSFELQFNASLAST